MAYLLALFSSASLLILCDLAHAAPPALTLTIVNNCNFTVWPAIQPNGGHDVLARGGFTLHTLTHHSFPAPSSLWTGRIWARTGCFYTNTSQFSCVTGDCGGRFECDGAGGSLPTTLAQFSLHHGHNDVSSYGVSLVDGFNVPMTITPHDGIGECPVVGCRADLLAACPERLRVRLGRSGRGPVVGCRSGCDQFGTDELCCRNRFNSPDTCRNSSYSDVFKRACPTALTYAHDTTSFMHECASPRELKVIFCH